MKLKVNNLDNNKVKDYVLQKLTELLIKQDMEDKKKGKPTYVKKTRCYKDLIKFLKDVEMVNK